MVRGRSYGKGFDFLDELNRVVRLVVTFPFAAPEVERGIRRRIFAHFPYALLYGIEDDTIVVLAVAHTHRHPRYWIGRIST